MKAKRRFIQTKSTYTEEAIYNPFEEIILEIRLYFMYISSEPMIKINNIGLMININDIGLMININNTKAAKSNIFFC